jgi:hypothetical protein
MTERSPKCGFAARPVVPVACVRAPDPSTNRTPTAEFTARLVTDVKPALRGRIKIATFQRGVTVADMLRALLADSGAGP